MFVGSFELSEDEPWPIATASRNAASALQAHGTGRSGRRATPNRSALDLPGGTPDTPRMRWLLVLAMLGFVTIGLVSVYVRASGAADCSARVQAQPVSCASAPPPFEIPLALGIEIVVLAVVGTEVSRARR
jgi:hypothetical protein